MLDFKLTKAPDSDNRLDGKRPIEYKIEACYVTQGRSQRVASGKNLIEMVLVASSKNLIEVGFLTGPKR